MVEESVEQRIRRYGGAPVVEAKLKAGELITATRKAWRIAPPIADGLSNSARAGLREVETVSPAKSRRR